MRSSLLAKAGAVLEAVTAADHPVAIKELVKILDMPLPTVSRLCADLVEIGLLEKTDYHHIIPGMTLVRFGQMAKKQSPLIATIKPHIDAYVAESGLSAVVYGFARNRFFYIYGYGSNNRVQDPLRYTGAFLVLLAVSAGIDAAKAGKIIAEKYPEMSDTEKVICDREFSALMHKKVLVRCAPGRKWMITMPFYYNGTICSLSFYGQGRENRTVEAELFEISKVLSRIRSGLDRIGKGDPDME